MNCVDVVIPSYNYARFLPRCVASVCCQNGVAVRILIIDDCSNDDTEAVGRLLAEQDERIEFRRHEKNRGHIATYNEGLLDWASSDYSLLLSADDALTPGALARATQVMENHPEVGMTYGFSLHIRGDNDFPSTVDEMSNVYKIISGSDFLRRSFLHGNAVDTPSAVVRTELQHRLGGYRADLPHSGDMEMWMRFAAHGSVGVVHSIQAYYRKHESNMSRQYYSNLLSDRQEVLQVCERIFSEWGERFPDSSVWRKMMLKRLSEESCIVANNLFDMGDKEGCRTCLEFARQIYPAICNSGLWCRIQVKRCMGPELWQKINPIWTYLKRINNTAPTKEIVVDSRTMHLSGWWPEDSETGSLSQSPSA